jgi:glycosyltransferase involved in cell wall biosynthesis
MLALAQEHKVLFVSPPFSLGEVLAHLRDGSLPKSGLIHRQANLHTLVFSKWLFQTYRYPKIEKLMSYLRKRKVERVMKKFGFEETVLFIWHPEFAALAKTFGEALTCYYVDDEFSEYAGGSEQRVKEVLQEEDQLLRKADLVLANGTVLLKNKNRYGNAINIPMTADFALFSRSRLPETLVPKALEAVPHPRIGYIGNLNDKVDFALLGILARARPEWSFVLVGPTNIRTAEVRADFDALQAQPNVFSLGSQPRESLPNYIKGFDVCTMCYRQQGWANSIYPLKLHEYLASGKPCIGSGLASLREFSEVVHVAETPQDWLDAIERAIADKNPGPAERRVQVAYENRLEARIDRIEKAIEQRIEEKRARSQARAKPTYQSAAIGEETSYKRYALQRSGRGTKFPTEHSGK